MEKHANSQAVTTSTQTQQKLRYVRWSDWCEKIQRELNVTIVLLF